MHSIICPHNVDTLNITIQKREAQHVYNCLEIALERREDGDNISPVVNTFMSHLQQRFNLTPRAVAEQNAEMERAENTTRVDWSTPFTAEVVDGPEQERDRPHRDPPIPRWDFNPERPVGARRRN